MIRKASALCLLLVLAAVVVSSAPLPARVMLTISGMHCQGCASGITAMLKRTEGIVSADVNYEQREATVDYNAAKTSPSKIIETVEKMGYKAAIKK